MDIGSINKRARKAVIPNSYSDATRPVGLYRNGGVDAIQKK